MTEKLEDLKAAPASTPPPRCEADGCGQAVHIYVHANGLLHCWTHRYWPTSDEGLLAADIKKAQQAAADRKAARDLPAKGI